MGETYQQRRARQAKKGLVEQKYEIPADLYGDMKTTVNRLQKTGRGTWTYKRFVIEGVRMMVKKYSR